MLSLSEALGWPLSAVLHFICCPSGNNRDWEKRGSLAIFYCQYWMNVDFFLYLLIFLNGSYRSITAIWGEVNKKMKMFMIHQRGSFYFIFTCLLWYESFFVFFLFSFFIFIKNRQYFISMSFEHICACYQNISGTMWQNCKLWRITSKSHQHQNNSRWLQNQLTHKRQPLW